MPDALKGEDVKTVLVSGLAGEVARLDVPADATGAFVKRQMFAATGILVSEQRLLVGSDQIQDSAPAPAGPVTLVFCVADLPQGCLFEAMRRSQWQRCLDILSHKYFAEVNSKGPRGETALHRAVASGRADVCHAIFARSDFEEVNAKTQDGRTALHIASWGGHHEICCTILGHADFTEVNTKSNHGSTALHLAAEAGHADICRAILAHGEFVEVNAKDYWGSTALRFATKYGWDEAAAAIRSFGGCE